MKMRLILGYYYYDVVSNPKMNRLSDKQTPNKVVFTYNDFT